MLVAAVIILAGVVVVASGRGGEMAPEYPDYPRIDLGPVTAADVVMMRPPSAAWGYNMRVTDEALEAIARAVTERDVRISALEQEVSDLRGQAGEHPLEAQPAIPDPASGPASGEDTAPACPLRDGTAAGEPGPEGAPYGAAVPGPAFPYGAPAHEESRSETTGYRTPAPGNRPTRRPPTASPRTRPSVRRRYPEEPPTTTHARIRPRARVGTCRGRRRLSRRSRSRPGRMSRPRAMTWTTVARDR